MPSWISQNPQGSEAGTRWILKSNGYTLNIFQTSTCDENVIVHAFSGIGEGIIII